jgi:hypothetical protein
MMIHILRDDQQFGPYTIEDLNSYLVQGSILPTDQAWYEGAVGWMPMDQVPGVILPGQAATPMAQPAAADPLAAANPAVVAAEAAAVSPAAQGAKKKKILIISGAIAGVLALAGVLYFVLKSGDEDVGVGAPKNGGSDTTFALMVEPIFKKSTCYDCHDGSDGTKVKGDFDLTKPDIIKESLDLANPDMSELVRRLQDKGEDRMPPDRKGEMLSPADVDKVKAWIAAGGKF